LILFLAAKVAFFGENKFKPFVFYIIIGIRSAFFAIFIFF